jgi:OmpA-OmpF porin, OOP family
MKIITMSVALVLALLIVASSQASESEFDRGYLGGKVGYNTNHPATNNTSNHAYLGAEAGYAWRMGGVLLGLDGYADDHVKSITGRDIGVDVKLGFPSDKFMPYVKLGVAGTNPGARVHSGVGMEYKFARHWSVVGEWSGDSKTVNSIDNTNSNISIGLNYYFAFPYDALLVAATVEPVEFQEPEPVVAPAPAPVVVIPPPPPPPPVKPAPAPVQKTIFTDKPITIEGANFYIGSARLKPSAFEQLDMVVDFAAKYKDANLTVVGFTDSLGSEQTNLRLSTKRAEAVKAYLVKRGVDPRRIATKGMGSVYPVGDNMTETGRAKNHRVEINSVKRVAQ